MEIIYIFIGWLFGIFSQPLSEKVKWWFNKKNIKLAIKNELQDLYNRFLSTSFHITQKRCLFTKKYIDEILPLFDKYETISMPKNFKELIKEYKKYDVDKLNQASSVTRKTPDTTLTKMHLTFTQNNLSSLINLDSDIYRRCLDLVFHINLFNEGIDEFRYNFRLTFDSNLIGNNREIVNENISISYKSVKRQSEYIAFKIDKILEQL